MLERLKKLFRKGQKITPHIETPESIEARREASRKALGKRWIGHPDYEALPAHHYPGSFYLDLWQAKMFHERGLL